MCNFYKLHQTHSECLSRSFTKMKKKFWDKTVAGGQGKCGIVGSQLTDPQAVLSQSQGVRGPWGATAGLVLSPRQRPQVQLTLQLLGGQASLDCLAARVEHRVGTFLPLHLLLGASHPHIHPVEHKVTPLVSEGLWLELQFGCQHEYFLTLYCFPIWIPIFFENYCLWAKLFVI